MQSVYCQNHRRPLHYTRLFNFQRKSCPPKKGSISHIPLAYAAIDDFFDLNVNTGYMSHKAGDFFFRVLTLGLLGGLANESEVN